MESEKVEQLSGRDLWDFSFEQPAKVWSTVSLQTAANGERYVFSSNSADVDQRKCEEEVVPPVFEGAAY